MTDLKPFASLSPSLLARKGQAKPAMRPQAYSTINVQDDLGWNDMGYPVNRASPPVMEAPAAVQPPAVVAQQTAIAEELGATSEPAPVRTRDLPEAEIVPISRGKAVIAAPAKAAFTLRLDPERHLKLRLACAVDHRSAQQIVTQALDAFLGAMPELDTLADKIPARGKH